MLGAIQHLSIAVELSPEDALYRIGFACALDSGKHIASQIDSSMISAAAAGELTATEQKAVLADIESLDAEGVLARANAQKRLSELGPRAMRLLSDSRSDPVVRRQAVVAQLLSSAWCELAIVNYERAFTSSFERDRKQENLMDMSRAALISYEAAQSYIGLVKQRGAREGREQKRLAEIEAGLETLNAIPTWVTPLLIPDGRETKLGELFDGATANFDLCGARIQQTWEWPTADASFLVWDPECSADIRSGRQLFGSATWWMFFEDGYHALEALDVDGNGWLTGSELEGLSVWRDADRDGHSSASEVQTLGERGIVALATTADGIDGLSPTCSRGVMFSDNALRPTFDWVTSPLAPRP